MRLVKVPCGIVISIDKKQSYSQRFDQEFLEFDAYFNDTWLASQRFIITSKSKTKKFEQQFIERLNNVFNESHPFSLLTSIQN